MPCRPPRRCARARALTKKRKKKKSCLPSVPSIRRSIRPTDRLSVHPASRPAGRAVGRHSSNFCYHVPLQPCMCHAPRVFVDVDVDAVGCVGVWVRTVALCSLQRVRLRLRLCFCLLSVMYVIEAAYVHTYGGGVRGLRSHPHSERAGLGWTG